MLAAHEETLFLCVSQAWVLSLWARSRAFCADAETNTEDEIASRESLLHPHAQHQADNGKGLL